MKKSTATFGKLSFLSTLFLLAICVNTATAQAEPAQNLKSDGKIYKRVCYSTDSVDIPKELNFVPKCLFADMETISSDTLLCTKDASVSTAGNGILVKACIHLIREVSQENYVSAAPVCNSVRRVIGYALQYEGCPPHKFMTQFEFDRNQEMFRISKISGKQASVPAPDELEPLLDESKLGVEFDRQLELLQ